ncbi:MAG: CapA family protein [Clostridia bacterium]|nr:CapA family protein [Clostridia bacterium]
MRFLKFTALFFALLLFLTGCAQTSAPVTTEAEATEAAATEPPQTEPGTQAPVDTIPEITEETAVPISTEAQTGPLTTETVTEPATEAPTTEPPATDPPETEEPEDPGLTSYEKAHKDADFLRFISDNYGSDVVKSVKSAVSNGKYSPDTWYRLVGKSIYVLYDEYTGRGDILKYRAVDASDPGFIDLIFCGDISLDDSVAVMKRYVKYESDINSIISQELIDLLKSSDVTIANHEFAASNRGKKLDKYYTYRGKPENVGLYEKMGVDFVSLANNHVYDYGLDAFLDTIQTMIDYGMDFAGAGKNLAEASEPFFYVINGRKIAIICGSRAEKHYITPIAEENVPGVFGMYDSGNMKIAVAKAKAESDFVIVYPHWGKENSYKIEDIIRSQGHEYIDCGADLIVGAHAHQLQGIEFYKGKMIAYNLGNFLFENPMVKTGVIEVKIDPSDLTVSAKFIPCMQDVNHVWLCRGDEYKTVLDYMISISPAVKIDGDGNIRKK